MTVGSLFAGIGGFDLGFERAGYEIAWQVELDEYCRKVLAKHFPKTERFGDIRQCGAHNLSRVDIICGGFPCQDISIAGKGAGLSGERSGLWREMFRIICELRPGIAVVENVAALLDRGIGRILGDLAGIGYDAEWNCLSACAFGATHSRPRVFLVAHSAGSGWQTCRSDRMGKGITQTGAFTHSSWWNREPPALRVGNGFPGRVDRLEHLGNSIVPQIAQWIAERIKVS